MLASVLKAAISLRGRMTLRTMRRLKSRAFRIISWPRRVAPARLWLSMRRNSSSE